jgi:hypothetical protein
MHSSLLPSFRFAFALLQSAMAGRQRQAFILHLSFIFSKSLN